MFCLSNRNDHQEEFDCGLSLDYTAGTASTVLYFTVSRNFRITELRTNLYEENNNFNNFTKLELQNESRFTILNDLSCFTFSVETITWEKSLCTILIRCD